MTSTTAVVGRYSPFSSTCVDKAVRVKLPMGIGDPFKVQEVNGPVVGSVTLVEESS